MSKSKAILNFLILLVFVSGLVILNEAIVITEPHLQLTFSKYVFLGGAFLLFVMLIFMVGFNKERSFINWKALLLLALAFSVPIAAALIQPTVISFTATDTLGVASTVSLTIGYFARFQSLFFGLSSALMTYLFFIVVPKVIPSKTFLMGFMYFLMAIMFALIVYSVIVEWDQYYLLFSTGDIDYYSPTISLFSNTNVFGYYLSLGIYGMGVLNSLKHRWWHYILMSIFLLSLLLTITITSYIGAFVFLSLYIIHDIYLQFRRHPVQTSLWMVGIGMFSFFLIVGLMLSDQPFARSLREDFIPESTESLLARVAIWRHARELFFGIHLIIGHGFAISNALLATAISVDSTSPTNRFHNGWYDILATGGVIGMVGYLAMIGFVIYLVFKRAKTNRQLAFTALFIVIGILVQSVAEAKVFFKADAMGTLGTFIVVVPLLVKSEKVDIMIETKPIERAFALDPQKD